MSRSAGTSLCVLCVMRKTRMSRDADVHDVFLPEGQVGSSW